MKISYLKRYYEGAVYDQTISMTKKELMLLQDAVLSEIALKFPRKDEYVFTSGYESFLKPLILLNNSICFLNGLQRRFINLFLKLKLKDRNTCILIKGGK